MESNEQNSGTTVMQENLQVTPSMVTYLNETRKWAMFLAIMGFIGCVFMVGIGLFFSVFLSQIGSILGDQIPMMNPFGGLMGVLYIGIALLYFFPSYYTYKFSTSTKRALETQDSWVLATAFENLKSVFKFIGIITIVFLSLYALILIGLLIAGIGAATMF